MTSFFTCSFLLQHAINSGIIKLSSLTPVINVYRGMTGLRLPPQLEVTDKSGSRLAIEYGGSPSVTSGNLDTLAPLCIECLNDLVPGLSAGFMSTVRFKLLGTIPAP